MVDQALERVVREEKRATARIPKDSHCDTSSQILHPDFVCVCGVGGFPLWIWVT